MVLSDFEYQLPRSSIAQFPCDKRDMSKLMVIRRDSSLVSHRIFHEIVLLLSSGDLLILNRAKVPPCRLRGRKETGGSVEVLLISQLHPSNGISGECWECLLKPASRLHRGQPLYFSPSLKARIDKSLGKGRWIVKFLPEKTVREAMDQIGQPPLPPYIKRTDLTHIRSDRERYQTVFGDMEGGVAAPTAGFHFTEDIMMKLRTKGINIAYLVLYPNTGSFLPVRTRDVENHQIALEDYEITEECANQVNTAKREGRRIVAVGTTTVRALESAWDEKGYLPARKGKTSLMILPGFAFKVIDALITNFHQPRSTHLMLVCAFIGREKVLEAYSTAISMNYRFLSYGDAMLII